MYRELKFIIFFLIHLRLAALIEYHVYRHYTLYYIYDVYRQ